MSLEEKNIDIKGHRVKYYEQGTGDPILLLHGLFESNVLWRDVINKLSPVARCIMLDFNLEENAKKDILIECSSILKQVIKKLNLRNVVLVTHGLGSIIGINYARANENNMKAIAFYEAHLYPECDQKYFSFPIQQILHRLVVSPDTAHKTVNLDNLISSCLPQHRNRKKIRSAKDMKNQPSINENSKKIFWQYLQQLASGDMNNKITESVIECSHWLKKLVVPKLMFYSVPGFYSTLETVKWCQKNLYNIDIIDLEEGMHQMSTQLLYDWYIKLQ